MSEEAIAPVAVASPAKKVAKATASKVKEPKVLASHPPVSDMVIDAVKVLKERGGSLLQAIMKYLAVNYKVDTGQNGSIR